MFPKSSGFKKIREDYQRFRWEAAKTSYNLGEWGDSDIVEYDLDEGWTFGLPVPTGKDNPETYREDRPLDSRGKDVDVRTLKNR